MKSIKNISFLLLLGFIIFACCKKKKNDPSPSNPCTDNCLSAKIDGVYWENCQDNSWGPPSISGEFYSGIRLIIDAKNSCTQIGTVYLDFYTNGSIGTYLLGDTTNNLGYAHNYLASSGGNSYYTDSTHIGTVIITKFDTTAKRVSGTFQFEAIDTSINKVLKITEGKISDVRYLKY